LKVKVIQLNIIAFMNLVSFPSRTTTTGEDFVSTSFGKVAIKISPGHLVMLAVNKSEWVIY